MSGKATTASRARTRRSVMESMSGREMQMEMAFVKFTPTPSKGCGLALRNFLRPFRGVHKKHLKYYVAICEHRINRKHVSPDFIAQLVAEHQLFT